MVAHATGGARPFFIVGRVDVRKGYTPVSGGIDQEEGEAINYGGSSKSRNSSFPICKLSLSRMETTGPEKSANAGQGP